MSYPDKITIGVKKPNEDIVYIEIEDKLENYRQIINGNIEGVRLLDKIRVYCDEDGKIKNLEPNFWIYGGQDIIVGTAIFVKQGVYRNNTLSKNDKLHIEKFLNFNKLHF